MHILYNSLRYDIITHIQKLFRHTHIITPHSKVQLCSMQTFFINSSTPKNDKKNLIEYNIETLEYKLIEWDFLKDETFEG